MTHASVFNGSHEVRITAQTRGRVLVALRNAIPGRAEATSVLASELRAALDELDPAGSYTRTDEQVESDPRSNVGLAKHFRDQRDDLEHRLNLAVMASEHNSERAEKAEQSLVEMIAHRDQWRDTAVKWQTEANRAEQPRPLAASDITDEMRLRAGLAMREWENREWSLTLEQAGDMVLRAALTPPPSRPEGAEELAAAIAEWDETGVIVRSLDEADADELADHLAALGYRKAES